MLLFLYIKKTDQNKLNPMFFFFLHKMIDVLLSEVAYKSTKNVYEVKSNTKVRKYRGKGFQKTPLVRLPKKGLGHLTPDFGLRFC